MSEARSKPYLIGIAGPSGAGKTYLAQHLGRELDSVHFNLDAYYRELGHLSLPQRAHQNFDAPNALDSELLIEHVRQLAAGQTIRRPVYDFTSHLRTAEVHVVEPKRYIILEGLFALYWEELRGLQGTKVYVNLGEKLCLERRIVRDMQERARTRESVLEQFRTTVAPMAERYVYPTRAHADVVVTGDNSIANEVASVLAHVRRGSAG